MNFVVWNVGVGILKSLNFAVSYVGGGVRCPNCKICFCRTEKMPINISPRKRFSLGCESYCIRFNFSAKKQKGKKFSSKIIMEFDRTSVTSGVWKVLFMQFAMLGCRVLYVGLIQAVCYAGGVEFDRFENVCSFLSLASILWRQYFPVCKILFLVI